MDYFSAMRAFVDAAELGSFSKAAERAGVKVSTVSRYVSALESDLGAALFNRSTRRINLTEVGRTFYARAAGILAELEDARFSAKQLNATPQGDLRINVPGAFGRRHLVPHLAAFHELYPDIRISAEFTETPLDLIENGIDVAIRIGNLADSTLIARRLAEEERLLVASPSYLSKAGRPDRPADIARHECLLASQSSSTWYFRPAGNEDTAPLMVDVGGPMRLSDPEALLRTAVDGLGLALLPSWLAAEDIRSGALQSLLTGWTKSLSATSESGIWAVYPPKKTVSPKVREFIGFFSRLLSRTSSVQTAADNSQKA